MIYYYDEARAQYIKIMEKIIAKHCSTDNYKFGNYRFPVKYRKDGNNYESRGIADVSYKDIPSMYYKFGAHRLDIGKALLELLDYIEDIICEENRFDPFNIYSDGNDDD